jgi:Ca2+-transporting ATPase
MLRNLYGANRMANEQESDGTNHRRGRGCHRPASLLVTVASALVAQLKEPLILMLLGSAAISLLLGNRADAVSIGIALLIVSLVAAIQEYRSEAALEKLANLVPHTCTVLRDGQVQDNFLAKDLIVGDLVLLATGEYVRKSSLSGSRTLCASCSPHCQSCLFLRR